MKPNFQIGPGGRSRGSAMLLALWGIIVLSAVVIGFVRMTQGRLQELDGRHAEGRARQLAASGLALALHPQVAAGDPVLKQEMRPEESFDAAITGENGRLQINAMLRANRRDVLSRLFQQWGLTGVESDTVIDCMLDWVSPGAGRRLNGATREHYLAAGLAYGPTGREFASRDEIALVLNFELLSRRRPDWRGFLTVWSDGKLDVNSASADVLAAYAGVPLGKAQEFVAYRDGPDGVAGSADDRPFEKLESVRDMLGLTPEAFGAIDDGLRLDSPVIRAVSVGRAHGCRVTVSAVARREPVSTRVLEWKEL